MTDIRYITINMPPCLPSKETTLHSLALSIQAKDLARAPQETASWPSAIIALGQLAVSYFILNYWCVWCESHCHTEESEDRGHYCWCHRPKVDIPGRRLVFLPGQAMFTDLYPLGPQCMNIPLVPWFLRLLRTVQCHAFMKSILDGNIVDRVECTAEIKLGIENHKYM